MNFDKESKSEKKRQNVGLKVREGGGGADMETKTNREQKNRYSLIFYAHALYKILSSWLKWLSSFNTNKRSNGHVRGKTLPIFYGMQSKFILTWILNNLLNFSI